jgi:DNA-binding response OmpR family regulator
MDAFGDARILLVEDDASIVAIVRDALAGVGAALEHTSTVREAKAAVRDRMFDAMVLDLGLPDGSGLDLAAELRADGVEVPILMLTARADVPDRLEGFARGADDYVCKPFAPKELTARLAALLRRSRPERSHILRYAGVELDLLKRVVQLSDATVGLSDREASLLAYFMRHPEQTVSREQLAQEVFGVAPDADTGVVNVYVNYLRNKLEYRLDQSRLIHTVRGKGYMLSAADPGESTPKARRK